MKQGRAAIENYFAEMAEDTILFLESKLLLVGSGDVGKTTLMKKLKDRKFKVVPGKEDTTRGFDYWLNAVKLFGKDSPLIMVMNKADLRLMEKFELCFKIAETDDYIIVYAAVKDFAGLCDKYREHLEHMDYETYPLKGKIAAKETGLNKISAYRARHRCDKSETVLYHLLVEM